MADATAPSRRHRRWTPIADARLRRVWALAFSLEDIAAGLGRTPRAVFGRACALKLPMGVPDDYEGLTAAARRAGYSTTQLRAILEWADVEMTPLRSDPTAKPRGAGIRKQPDRVFVAAVDVDDAVARWISTETLVEAAARTGVHRNTIRKWLEQERVDRGLRLTDIGRRGAAEHGKRWRISRDVVDAVVARRRSRRRRLESTARAAVVQPEGE